MTPELTKLDLKVLRTLNGASCPTARFVADVAWAGRDMLLLHRIHQAKRTLERLKQKGLVYLAPRDAQPPTKYFLTTSGLRALGKSK